MFSFRIQKRNLSLARPNKVRQGQAQKKCTNKCYNNDNIKIKL